MAEQEFTIESLPNQQFRTLRASPIDLLAIGDIIGLDADLKSQKELHTFALEHIETKVGEKWFPVKTAGRDVYMPMDLTAYSMRELSNWYFQNIIVPTFQKPAE